MVPKTVIVFFSFSLLCLSAEKSRYDEPYPAAYSKKGLQVEMVEDALLLGVKHAALNFNIAQLVDPDSDPDNPKWVKDGREYYFNRTYLDKIDSSIKKLSDRGVLVNLIVLAYQSGNAQINKIILHPRASRERPNPLSAFNSVTEEGRRWFVAIMEFIAERWSHPEKKNGRVVGYIIGNEVNSHWWWSNMGRVNMKDFTADYLRTMRLAHGAVRRQSSWARVYISLDHHWNIRYKAGDEGQAFAGRSFITYFAELAKEGGDFEKALMDKYKSHFSTKLDLIEYDSTKGELLATASINKRPVILMAKTYQLTKVQKSILTCLLEGLNYQL